jgi:CheY-like chemotaxis protein
MPRKIPQILTVDDDAVTCELLCEVFAREGLARPFANSGEAALEEVARQPPDLLLSDIRMKTPLDGLSLLERVRREYPSIPVVLMTAFGSIETAIRAVKQAPLITSASHSTLTSSWPSCDARSRMELANRSNPISEMKSVAPDSSGARQRCSRSIS